MMADTALDKQQDSRKPERACAWCGADISHRHGLAKFCDELCRRRNHCQGPIPGDRVVCLNCESPFLKVNNERHCSAMCRADYQARAKRERAGHKSVKMAGPFPPAQCAVCGDEFEMVDPRQIYCARGGSCAQAAFRKSDTWRQYVSRDDVRERWALSRRKYAESEHGKLAQKERDARPNNVARRTERARSDMGRQVNREYQRRRAAAAALSAILLPAQQHPEI